MEQQKILEAKLNHRLKKERWILAAVWLLSSIIGIIFTVLFKNSKEIVRIGEHPMFYYESVQYDYSYTWGYAIGFFIAIMTLAILAFHFIYCRYTVRQTTDNVITLYRSFFGIYLYINGEKQDSIVFSIVYFDYYLEGELKDGTKATVALSQHAIRAHITFSDGRRPIDI